MGATNTPEWKALFDELKIKTVVRQDVQFKAQLDIGEDVYRLLRTGNVAAYVAHASIAGVAGAATAASPVVAGTFFPAGGILGLVGLGTAVTPIGWVTAAGVLSATIWTAGKIGYDKLTHESSTRVPAWLNTPLDVLAVGIFEIVAPLALLIANTDGEIDAREENEICHQWFVRKWGYDPDFVRAGVRYYTGCIEKFEAEEVGRCLVRFLEDTEKKHDCNAHRVLEKITKFLQDMNQMNHRDDRWDSEVFYNVEKILLKS